MIRRLPVILTLALFFFASPVLAQGLYVGGGIGNTFFSSEFEDALDQIQKIDKNATAWKLFGGFSPNKFLGIEGGYRQFGTVKAGSLYESKTTAWDVEGLGLIRIAIIDIFGKAGAMFWSRDTQIGSSTSDTSATDFFWGLGAGIHLGPLGVRGEWESVVIGSPDNLSMVSLSVTLGF
ncbi:MAG: outer membrane beta-barrel protein [Longimicrobiales bacterium]